VVKRTYLYYFPLSLSLSIYHTVGCRGPYHQSVVVIITNIIIVVTEVTVMVLLHLARDRGAHKLDLTIYSVLRAVIYYSQE